MVLQQLTALFVLFFLTNLLNARKFRTNIKHIDILPNEKLLVDQTLLLAS